MTWLEVVILAVRLAMILWLLVIILDKDTEPWQG